MCVDACVIYLLRGHPTKSKSISTDQQVVEILTVQYLFSTNEKKTPF